MHKELTANGSDVSMDEIIKEFRKNNPEAQIKYPALGKAELVYSIYTKNDLIVPLLLQSALIQRSGIQTRFGMVNCPACGRAIDSSKIQGKEYVIYPAKCLEQQLKLSIK